ncbi:MAG: tRNA 2-thiouridine(34) synthase MnmA [Oscillospiraceae bacterium]
MSKKVYVGLSGGVDSSVAALLLKQKGFDVVGVNLLLTAGNDNSANEKAKKVAQVIDIPFKTVDLRDEFNSKVIDYFINEYFNARTPNPCVSCNENIKFGKLLDIAISDGADYLATGHYAEVTKKGDRYLLKKCDSKKDQSYFLHRLSQNQLSRALFPVNMSKEETRKIASDFNLPVAQAPDSQEICFISDDDYARYITEATGKMPQIGNFVDKDGNVIGKHKGLIHYTVGQRKGLGITFGKPMYVTALDPQSGDITLGEEGSQMSCSLVAEDVNYISVEKLCNPTRARVKIRCQAPLVNACLTPLDEKTVRVEFDTPQRAITPGQCAVFYDDEDSVIGGGYIR